MHLVCVDCRVVDRRVNIGREIVRWKEYQEPLKIISCCQRLERQSILPPSKRNPKVVVNSVARQLLMEYSCSWYWSLRRSSEFYLEIFVSLVELGWEALIQRDVRKFISSSCRVVVININKLNRFTKQLLKIWSSLL